MGPESPLCDLDVDVEAPVTPYVTSVLSLSDVMTGDTDSSSDVAVGPFSLDVCCVVSLYYTRWFVWPEWTSEWPLCFAFLCSPVANDVFRIGSCLFGVT